jgi:hypothetical protein
VFFFSFGLKKNTKGENTTAQVCRGRSPEGGLFYAAANIGTAEK